MKIESGRSVSASATPKRAGSAAASGFTPAADAPPRMAAASSASAVTPLGALLALQADGEPGQRRWRQARRGRDVLDALEKLLRGLALGIAAPGVMAELASLRRRAEPTGEAGLDEVLLEIDTRLEVELAKLEMASAFSTKMGTGFVSENALNL